MGQKVHPTGFRVGVIYDWQSKWYADSDYSKLLQEDLVIRKAIQDATKDAGVAKVEIDRNANIVTVTIHTAKPGIVIGRSGQKVEELRNLLEAKTGKRLRVNINEIRMPELDAHLVARNIADQLERRVAFRRALKQTVARTMARGAEGCKAQVAGRLGGSEMSRREATMDGRVPLHTLRADIDFGRAEAHTTFGRIGVKVWIYKGEILPEKKAEEDAEEAPSLAQAAEPATAAPSVATTEEATPAPTEAAAVETPEPVGAEPVAEQAAPTTEEQS
jgi:small subunit ribosomal protein S3